jgi:glycerol-3-phosphate cytidylyltransferase
MKNQIVYTGGTFDLFHRGHLEFLRRCVRYGDVTVSLNTDGFIESYKGSLPILTYEEREAVLLGCRYVSDVVANESGSDSRPTIEKVKPNLIIIGSDWAERDYYSQMGFNQGWLDDRDIALCYLPYTKGISTTELKKRVKDSS